LISLNSLTNCAIWSDAASPFPAALVHRGATDLLHRERRQRVGARVHVFPGGAGPANDSQAHDLGRGAAHRGQYREAAGLAEAVGPAYRVSSSVGGRHESKVPNMTVGDDDYGDAFKKAKLEHDERRQGDTEAKRLQAEADADIAVLSDVLLPQLQGAAQQLGLLGGNIDIRQYGRAGKALRPASVGFRITDQPDHQDQPDHEKGHQSRAYLIVPQGGMVTVTSGDGFDPKTGQPRQPDDVSKEVGIQRRNDVTIENVKKLILRAIEEYRNDRDAT
jgi:hypothetical protein